MPIRLNLLESACTLSKPFCEKRRLFFLKGRHDSLSILFMQKTLSPILRTGTLALLLPVLLLLPAFHTHPEHRHAHGHDSTHSHPAVIHADFFAVSAHDHTEHDQGHGVPGENSSPSDFHLISLCTLLPRSPVLLTPAFERVPFALLSACPVLTSRSLSQVWGHPSDYPLPVQAGSFPAILPRSPPHYGSISYPSVLFTLKHKTASAWR